jgi:lysozyme
MDIDKLTASIKLHEGSGPMENGRYMPYTDTTGHTTIGNGINISEGIDQDENDYLVSHRLQLAVGEAETESWWNCIQGNDARENAFIEIGWNIGFASLSNFHNALAAASGGDWDACAAAFLDSLWAKQVGQRAETLAAMIVTGQFPNS